MTEKSVQIPEISEGTDLARSNTRLRLEQLERSSSAERNELYDQIVNACNPEHILEESLSLYESRYKEVFLVQAVSLLETFGARAWEALRRLAHSGSEECELFVPLIASCAGVSEESRLDAMVELGRSPHEGVREAVSEWLSDFSESARREFHRRLLQRQ